MTAMTVASKAGRRHQQPMTAMTVAARAGSRHTLSMTAMTVANPRLMYDVRGTTEARRRHIYYTIILRKIYLTACRMSVIVVIAIV